VAPRTYVFPVSLAKALGESVGNATGTGSDAALPVPAWSNQISGGLCKNSSALSIDFRSISKRNSWIFHKSRKVTSNGALPATPVFWPAHPYATHQEEVWLELPRLIERQAPV